jgi:hypothetical protein
MYTAGHHLLAQLFDRNGVKYENHLIWNWPIRFQCNVEVNTDNVFKYGATGTCRGLGLLALKSTPSAADGHKQLNFTL